MNAAALWLVVRPARTGLLSAVLPVVTFAVMTTAVLSSSVVARHYWHAPDSALGGYQVLGAAQIGLLLVPLNTLAASAARLSTRRRDERLATLRLLGAPAGWVRLSAVAEATLLALSGTVIGVGIHLISAPLLTLLPVHGQRPSLSQVWMPWWVVAIVATTILAVAGAITSVGLGQVVISPLGLRRRIQAPHP